MCWLNCAIGCAAGIAGRSPTTRDFDTIGKLDEYKMVESLARIVVIEPNAPEVIVWAREEGRRWRKGIRQGLEEAVEMPEIGDAAAAGDLRWRGVSGPAAAGDRGVNSGCAAGQSGPPAPLCPATVIRIRYIME
jgi:hypothetical protein